MQRQLALTGPGTHAPDDWESARARMAEIAPQTRIVFVGRVDAPEDLAALVAPSI